MEYLHESSMPASKSELQVFSIPPTQTAIESSYEVEYRPNASLESSNFYEINVPASEDFTDLACTMLHIHLSVKTVAGAVLTEANKVKAVTNFGNSLFEQVDLSLGSVNTVQANNTYHYQSYFEDCFFRFPNPMDSGFQVSETNLRSSFDLYFRLHSPLCEQDKLLINGVPLTFRFTKSPDGFSLIKYDAADTAKYEIKFEKFSLHIKRVKLFPEAQKSIIAGLEKGPAKYFITRNDTRVFSIPSGQSSASIENVYHGVLPRRILVGLVKDAAQEESIYLDPFEFKHFNTNFISLNVDGNMIPSIPYSPNFSSNYYMREFINLYRFFGQDEGIPQLNITYDEYGKSSTLFSFDLSPDGSIGAENGTLSLIKRGNIRLDIKFSDRLKQSLKVIVFAQFDNLITIDKDRNVNLDY
ncbi:uncharacterized protein F54H12.2-like [Panonychus citri]|uniref:uncharacterized protein F54H12.2-like n=1 Tax=Panonychus citri TaxID=50023 RepID=UPI0023080B8A|nr:uncharacterized protein F54H12.2-like [Panonychus citri]